MLKRLSFRLIKERAKSYAVVVATSAADPASLQFLAPYTGCTLSEWFRNRGSHALVIFDDISKHSAAYRQISLLLRKSPTREAYPGDLFYIHAKLLERSGKLAKVVKNGSLTSLPIVETQAGDVSAFVPTNLISITDGQIYLESNLFNKGVRPALSAGISVSRVGGYAQHTYLKKYSGSIRLGLAQYREVEYFATLGSDLDSATLATVNYGLRILQLLKQKQYQPISLYTQVLLAYAGSCGLLDLLKVNVIEKFKILIDFVIKRSYNFSYILKFINIYSYRNNLQK
jgi:F-type H+-transporting ATPase subunit alpha